jgi:MFS family permease
MSSTATIRLLFAIQLLAMGAMEMSGPFWPLHLRRLAPSDAAFAFAGIAVYVGPMLGTMLTAGFWGRLGDRVGHKPMMVRALLALALTQAALACTTDVAAILVLRFLQGACAGFIAPAQAYGVGIEVAERRSRLFAFLQVATNVGSLAGAVAGGLVLDAASFFWVNAGAAALCGLCAAATWLLLPRVPPVPAPATRATGAGGAAATHGLAAAPVHAPADCKVNRTVDRSVKRTVAGLLAIIGLLLVSRMLVQTPFPLYVSAQFGARHWLVGLCYGLLALGFVIAAPAWARHFEGRSVAQALPRVAGVAAGCALLTALAGLTREVSVFAALYFAWGLLLGATTPVLTALVSRAVGPAVQGRVLGLAQSTNQLASIAGITIGVGLSEWAGLAAIYFFVALSYVLAALLIVAVQRDLKPRPAAINQAGALP